MSEREPWRVVCGPLDILMMAGAFSVGLWFGDLAGLGWLLQ